MAEESPNVETNKDDAVDETARSSQDIEKVDEKVIDDDASDSKYIWLHGFYHSIVAIVGTGILGFPHAVSYLGWIGGTIFILCVTAYSYYTALLLISLQEKGQGTYADVADAVMGVRFSRYIVKPTQYLNFFPLAAIMIVIAGGALHTLDTLDGKEELSARLWMLIAACIVMLFSLMPDLSRAWHISVMGAFAAFVIVVYSIAGSGVALADASVSEAVEFDRPPSTDGSNDDVFKILTSFGDILFGYGFHAIVPDIQASLHERSAKTSHKDMNKAVTAAFSFSFPAYLTVALMGYAAFGYGVEGDILNSINDVLPKGAMYPIWLFVVLKTTTEAAIYNQAAFTLTRDIFGLALDSDNVDDQSKNGKLDIVIRVVWVALAAIVAIFLPYFGDLASITAAISITPTTCLIPVIMWNKKHGETAPKWRLWLHYLFLLLFTILGAVALTGAIADMVVQVNSS